MSSRRHALNATLLCAALAGCAAPSPAPPVTGPAQFAHWDCTRIADELDQVQQRAADVAYAADERAGDNILSLGVGVRVFWPAMLAMRPVGLEAADLARLKARFEALHGAAQDKHCAWPAEAAGGPRTGAQPLSTGERLVYEERRAARGPGAEWVLRLSAQQRGEIEYRSDSERGALWRQDRAGNVTAAPKGALQWPHLLRGDLALGAVTGGDILVAGDPLARARMRGQVVAVGPQLVAGRRFDAVVIELFGDAPRGEHSTRVDGAIVLDRLSGVLLCLDLRSSDRSFSLQRRLVRVEPGRVEPVSPPG